jgi:endonuclease/exonuclease/phosphatase family metal-dependent hydrolase
MIRRDAGVSQWKRIQYSIYAAVLELQLDYGTLTVINVYNPRGLGLTITEWPRITQAIQEAKGHVVLLGDFNAHHPTWGGKGTACKQAANHLLVETERRGLKLVTPAREIT